MTESLDEIIDLINEIRKAYPEMTFDNVVDVARLVTYRQMFVDVVASLEGTVH